MVFSGDFIEGKTEMEKNCLTQRNNSENFTPNHTPSFEKNKVHLQWKDITYKTPDGKSILNGLSGSASGGKMIAVMGPSGSGKTSLVNVLSGFSQKRVTGQILVNGVERNMSTFRNLTSYVLQDDVTLPRFTVRELITFASKLKLPSTVTEKERQKAVDDCIYGLGLVGQQHQKASTLSGGQKKRLCIAQEIVNNPSLIFLDEPTSGLDSASCLQCIMLLKSMADKGKNIICTIHQPSSRIYEMFDSLYMLSDGNCIYKGPTKDLLPYLNEQGLKCPKYYSPTDFLTDVAIGLHGDWAEKLKDVVKVTDDSNSHQIYSNDVPKKEEKMSMLSSIRNKIKVVAEDSWQDLTSNHHATSNFNQFRVLLYRRFLDQVRDPIHLHLKFFGSILLGFILGSLFYGTGNDGSKVFYTTGLLFTLIIFLVIIADVPTILTFPLQRAIFQREHGNGWYSTKMYYLATTAAELPYQTICPMINCGLLYCLSGQPMELSRFALFLLSGVLLALISESVGLMIGAVCNVEEGIYLSVATTGCILVLDGSLMPLKFTSVYYRWVSYLLYSTYGIQSMFIVLFSNRPAFECSDRTCFFKDPARVIKYCDMEGSLLMDYIIMLLFFIVFRCFSYILLQMKVSLSK